MEIIKRNIFSDLVDKLSIDRRLISAHELGIIYKNRTHFNSSFLLSLSGI